MPPAAMVSQKRDVSCETEGCDEWVKSIVAYGTFSTVPSQRANLCFRTNIKLVRLQETYNFIATNSYVQITFYKLVAPKCIFWNKRYNFIATNSYVQFTYYSLVAPKLYVLVRNI